MFERTFLWAMKYGSLWAMKYGSRFLFAVAAIYLLMGLFQLIVLGIQMVDSTRWRLLDNSVLPYIAGLVPGALYTGSVLLFASLLVDRLDRLVAGRKSP